MNTRPPKRQLTKLLCWDVASLVGMLEANVGPTMVAHTPDTSLRRPEPLSPKQQFDEAMPEFGELLREMYGDEMEGGDGA
ncbi:MAG: hypothetical protein WAS49_06045 [Candidatus Dechloromonas phosphoritropha]|jgi:hypothetical protein